MSIESAIAQTILVGFNKHYRLFRELSAAAKQRFERGLWKAAREAAVSRIQMYDKRVEEAVQAVRAAFPEAETDESLWPRIKIVYIGLLHGHLQPELAETFYNSVACSVLHRRYYHNQYIFWRPAVSTEHLEGRQPTYRCYYPSTRGLRRTLLDIVTCFNLANAFEDIRRDVRNLLAALNKAFAQPWHPQPNFQVQVLGSLFYRNKGAYVVGRAINGSREFPFVVALLQNARGDVYADALLLDPAHLAVLFSFARAYFMVDMEVPSAYVSFLRSLLPDKPVHEIYTMLGLQKHGKTLFYRDLHHHLKHSSDNFVVAPGIKGMVMAVFTLPSFPYVFKMIRDHFAPPKDTDKKTVKEKYLLVKYHDRVGRLADTLEYSNVAFPLQRFDPALLQELDWRPSYLAHGSASLDPIRQMVFSFYDDQLYRIVIDYDRERTHGMKDADIIEAVAVTYGMPSKAAMKNAPAPAQFVGEVGESIARWHDDAHSVILYRSPYTLQFRLIVTARLWR